MSYANVRQALEASLNSFAEIHDLPVAWPNFTFEPGESYLRPFLLTGEPSAATLGQNGEDRIGGIYQIDVVGPRNAGTKDLLATVDLLCSHFDRGTDLTANGTVITIERAWPGPALSEPEEYFIPVSVSWFSYA